MKKIVIEIADDDYNRINSYSDGTTFYPITARLYKAVKDGKPLDDLRAELGRCKTWHEMQLSERDTKGKLMISDIFCHIITIIDGYTTDNTESENE